MYFPNDVWGIFSAFPRVGLELKHNKQTTILKGLQESLEIEIHKTLDNSCILISYEKKSWDNNQRCSLVSSVTTVNIITKMHAPASFHSILKVPNDYTHSM